MSNKRQGRRKGQDSTSAHQRTGRLEPKTYNQKRNALCKMGSRGTNYWERASCAAAHELQSHKHLTHKTSCQILPISQTLTNEVYVALPHLTNTYQRGLCRSSPSPKHLPKRSISIFPTSHLPKRSMLIFPIS